MDPPPAAPGRPASLWRNRDYMLLWIGQAVSTTGSAMSSIAIPLLILALTGSPAAAGIAGMLYTVPYVILSLPAGALVDRWDRKRVMILCDAVRACAFASIPLAEAFGVLTVWQLYAVALVEGSLFVFFNIAEVAALPRVVDKTQLGAATAQNLVTQSLSGLIGPGLGGWLYQVVGRTVPFAVDALSFAGSVLSLFAIRTGFQGSKAPASRDLRGEIRAGLAWAWNEPLVRASAFLSGGTNFVFAGGFLILIVLAKNLRADEASIGAIFSVGSIGAILGAALGDRVNKRFTLGTILITTTLVNVVLFPLYALAPNVLVLGAISAVIFATSPIYSVAVLSYRLALIPDALQGRVNSAVRLVAFGFQPLGSALAGILLERIGAGPTVGVFSVVLVGLLALVLLTPTLRRAGRPALQRTAAE